jgi:hypothetical protein
MNDETTLPHDRIRELTIECFATENLELRARVADLESDNRVLRELAIVATEQLHRAHVREQHLTRRVRDLAAAARAVRAAERLAA